MPAKPYLKRDELGWRVPRAGSKMRCVYDMMVLGKKRSKISAALGIKANTVGVMIWKIRNPEDSNHRQLEYLLKRELPA